MSSLTADRLRAVRIFNSRGVMQATEQLSLPWCYYAAQPSPLTSGWFVAAVDHQVDPDGHYTDYGQKHFSVGVRAERESQLKAAKAWIRERYGVELERGPFAAWYPAGTAARLRGAVREREAASAESDPPDGEADAFIARRLARIEEDPGPRADTKATLRRLGSTS